MIPTPAMLKPCLIITMLKDNDLSINHNYRHISSTSLNVHINIEAITHRMASAQLQVSTYGFAIGQIDVAQWDADFTNRIITTKPIIVKNLHVQCFSW